MTEVAAIPPAPNRRWLFGPLADLVLGCGLGYALLFTFQVFAGGTMRAWLPFALLPLLTLLVSGPHYGATLLRVYQRREDRQKYAFFAVYVTLALVVVFLAGLRSAYFGSMVLTLYLTWSPWHYTAQNYGISLMFLGRRGVRITLLVKRLIYASFVSSYVLLFFSFHGGGHVGDYAPAAYDGSVYAFVPLGIPTSITKLVLPVAATVYVFSVACAGFLLLRRSRARDLLPTFMLIVLQGVWFTAPVLARLTGRLQGVEPLSLEYATYSFMWIAVGHAVQYLWITSYFAKQSGVSTGHARFLGRSLVVGSAVWVVPVVLFAPGVLGQLPKDMGLGVMTASVVNLHHFVLDGAIWKLRDSRIARVLMRSAGAQGAPVAGPTRMPRWAIASAWGLGALALAWGLGSRAVTYQFRTALERQDLETAAAGVDRMEAFLVSGPDDYIHVSALALERGDLPSAQQHAERSLALYPTPRAWTFRGRLHGLAGDWEATSRAAEAAVELEPGYVAALSLAGEAQMRLGEPGRALELLERALEIDPDDAVTHRRLGSVLLALNDLERAREHLERADELGDHGALANLGEALRRIGDLHGAVEVYRRSAASSEIPQTLRRLAWILCTTSDESLRDPEEALELAQRLNETSAFQHPGHLETLAAASAATGDFETAIRWQLEALGRIDPKARAVAQQRLDGYRAGRPVREQVSDRR